MPELEWLHSTKRAKYPESDILRSEHCSAKTIFQMQSNSLLRQERRRLKPTRAVVVPALLVLSQLLVCFHASLHTHDLEETESPSHCSICLQTDRFEDGSPSSALQPALSIEPASTSYPQKATGHPPSLPLLRPPATGPPA